MSNLVSYYTKKDASYFSNERDELIKLIDRSALRVLDIGCGTGATGRKLLETGKASWVTGIELVPEKGAIARSVLNEIRTGDIEHMTLNWSQSEFDCILFGDIIEHLWDPKGLLQRLRPLLKEDGIAVASIPNVSHLPVLGNLILRDDW